MGCNSGRVDKVADDVTGPAAQAIQQLQASVKAQSDGLLAEFEAKVAKSIKDGKLTDNRVIKEDEDFKTEYTSEFSLDKIAGVIKSALTAASKVAGAIATSPGKPPVAIALSPEAVDAYIDVVNSVTEAAKSTSTAAGSLSYSMNRIGLGVYAFLYAVSDNIYDEGLFGTEAVTTTAVYYRIIQSTGDIQNEAQFQAAKINSAAYLLMVQLQADLVNQLADGKIDMDTYISKDDKFTARVAVLKKRLADTTFNPDKMMLARGMHTPPPTASEVILRNALTKLASSAKYPQVIELSQKRLNEGYFKH